MIECQYRFFTENAPVVCIELNVEYFSLSRSLYLKNIIMGYKPLIFSPAMECQYRFFIENVPIVCIELNFEYSSIFLCSRSGCIIRFNIH